MINRIASIFYTWKGSEVRRRFQEANFNDNEGVEPDADINNVNNLEATLLFIRTFILRERNCIIVEIRIKSRLFVSGCPPVSRYSSL